MTNEEILTTLRDVYGMQVSNYDEQDPMVVYINKAVQKLSEYYPEVELDFVLTVANQTRYSVNAPVIPTLLKVKKVYYTFDDSLNSLFNDPDIKVGGSSAGMGSFSPSAGFERVYRLEMLRKLTPKDANIISHDKFDLIPTPDTSDQKVYYEYERYRTIAEVPKLFEDDIIELIFFFMGDKVYKKEVVSQGGNMFNFDRRGNIEKSKGSEQVDTYRQRKTALGDIVKAIQTKVMKIT
jgi:predicted nucleic-acid-binding protein